MPKFFAFHVVHLWKLILIFLYISGSCKTVSGAKPNTTCIFPFEYQGHIYQTCKHDLDNTRWCSTKVDSNGKHQLGHWGNCGEDCPKGCHVINQKREIVECKFPFHVPYSINGNQLFHDCLKQYPEDEVSPMICYTKKNSTTNEAVIGQGDWGICEKELCPDFNGKHWIWQFML